MCNVRGSGPRFTVINRADEIFVGPDCLCNLCRRETLMQRRENALPMLVRTRNPGYSLLALSSGGILRKCVPLRHSINVPLDGCNDHAIPADEDVHRHAVENLGQADALFGRLTYEMMRTTFQPPARPAARPESMEPCAQTINAIAYSRIEALIWR